jgi:tRNA-specific 2-thiouridylase
MEEDFRRLVVDRFVADYRRGRTPIPCADCNHLIKFDRLLRRALGLGARRLVTGHYARLVPDPGSGRIRLRRGADPDKDQSYFLFGLTQEMLSYVDFPVGSMTKTEVRALARRAGLPNADKPESQDICFVPDGDYRGFVDRAGRAPEAAGEIVDISGRRLGVHSGISQFTVGQRRGLGLGGGRRQYVVAVDPESRRVVVGELDEAFCRSLVTGPVNWVSRPRPARAVYCRVQVRHRQRPVPARMEPRAGGNVRIVFREAQTVAAPGQAAVFYDGDELMGGGWIEEIDVGRVISLGDAPGADRAAPSKVGPI